MESPRVKNSADIFQYKYFHIMSCLYVSVIFVSITQANRLIPVSLPFMSSHFVISGGTLTIPFAFFLQNIITEVYGYVKARHLVQVALLIIGSMVIYQYLLTFLPIPKNQPIVESYNIVFKSIPRHIIAFILAAFCGNIINDYLISKSKIYFHGKYLRTRFICVTAISEAVYLMFGFLVWTKYLNIEQNLFFATISYVYRLAFEGVTLPLSNLFCVLLKKHEGVDVYDNNINYNPFLWYSERTKDDSE